MTETNSNSKRHFSENIEITKEQAYEILYKYHKNYNGFNTINDRGEELYDYTNLKYFNFNRYEINNLVIFWQKTKDTIVRDAIFETYMIFFKKMLPKYLAVSNTIRKDQYSYDLDMFQDYVLILDKCLSDYKCVEDASFKSYAHHWFQFLLGEGIRTKYFSLLIFPQHIIKQERKKNKLSNKLKNNEEIDDEELKFLKEHQEENYNFIKNELEEGIALIEIEDSILANVFNTRILDIIKKAVKDKKIKMSYLDWFLKKHGIFSREYKQTELSALYKVSNSTISKGIKAVKDLLSQNEELKKIYYGE